MKTEQITTTKKQVLEAAASCPTAKRTLEILFPQVFGEKKEYDLYILVNPDRSINLSTNLDFLERWTDGELYGILYSRDLAGCGCPELIRKGKT